ncbi:MAG: lytic transglycosylase domain-containing protein [Mesorhizobium sp.]|uniref:lytic transglycosylase domain-containing protein n=1 Tax=unclassified Mesorhizobium TaxID=325217 RepID=UPI000FCC3AB9|nr:MULTISPECIES: lytic transglycosylase domain-containing protein [unclassified Mesorhizobium]RUV67559.1 lytic transglycosylase domain-containing protein [Mesorhizobium sp. M5C.F.Cr.IN.023.01.1.1]RWF89154.1 MAG: lytic transglycosylase domain-containing protein [Mesorhizobium sp.]RWF92520.1 MAG: lytic transglycosylase domain-containing protein [Mesorhizobium sp.]RWI40458.1 MAG: lytic transglycosylase domain-containing protein [Mesorhizobium sp.]RWI53832.1 MAG: lytic transglycosylase domain-cont
MPAKIIFPAIGVMLAAAGLSGCSSTSQTKAVPSLTETAAAGADAGFTLALPDTVSVLPESSGIAPVQTVALAVDPAATPAQPAAFAGPTPLAATAPAAMTVGAAPAGAAPVYATAAVAMPVTGETGKTMPGVQQAAYVVPDDPSALLSTSPAKEYSAGPRGEIERLIEKYAVLYEVPVDLVRRVVNRESTFNPKAYNRGHWGLMQIKHATARGMGYDGPASGLFDAETNLKYAVKYLRGAWLVAGGNAKRADRLYQSGYYYDAKRKGMLEETGLGRDRGRRRLQPDA